MHPSRRLLVATAIVALAVNGWLARSDPSVSRLLFLLSAGAALGWALARRSGGGSWLERSLVAGAAWGAFWWACLSLVLGEWTLFARGALTLAAAATAHGATLFATLSRHRRDDRRDGRTVSSGAAVVLYALVFAAVTLGTLAGTESLARLVSPLRTYELVPDDPSAGPCLLRHPDGRLVGRPGCTGRYVHREFDGVRVEINALGLRDGLDETASPSDGERSVVVLGDSFAFGLGVPLEATFHERLEERLRGDLRSASRVFGAAMPGAGVVDERRVLEELAPIARPDLVVLALFEGNDLQDTWSRLREPDASAASRPIAPPRPEKAFLGAVVGRRFWLTSSSLLQLGRVDGRPTRLMEMALEAQRPERIDEMTDALIEEIGRVESLCRRLDADLVVLLVPTILQAEPARFEAFVTRRPGERYDRTAFHRDLAARLSQSGSTIVDPLERLESESLAGRACYYREGHWNSRGHAVAADVLAAVVAARLAEPDDPAES